MSYNTAIAEGVGSTPTSRTTIEDGRMDKIERKVSKYLRYHIREADCPCRQHQNQVRSMAKDIVKIVRKEK